MVPVPEGPEEIGALAEIRIERIVYGGSGLGHVEGRALLVPFSAPGDRLRVRIRDRAGTSGKKVLHASIETVIEPSPSRREPVCRHFGVCGGCQLQHLSRESELRAKAEFLRDCLRRIAGIRWEEEIVVASGPEYGWRSRVSLHVSGSRAGFFRAGSHEIVPIEDCPVLVTPLRDLVRALASGATAIPEEATELALVAGDAGEIAAEPALSIAGARESARQRIAGLDFEFRPGSFSQANRTLVESLVDRAVGGRGGSTAVDLYAGAGLFALPLARRFQTVHAVEADAVAVRSGRENTRRNRIDNVRYHESDVAEWLASFGASLRPDLILLDPPRTGAGRGVVEGILDSAPREIVYVACDPATWARDLRRFVDGGCELRSVEALDLFPRSYHVEAIARLARATPTEPRPSHSEA
jgi:23S rRNA (uracil1939-C5)-methyltransferase